MLPARRRQNRSIPRQPPRHVLLALRPADPNHICHLVVGARRRLRTRPVHPFPRVGLDRRRRVCPRLGSVSYQVQAARTGCPP